MRVNKSEPSVPGRTGLPRLFYPQGAVEMYVFPALQTVPPVHTVCLSAGFPPAYCTFEIVADDGSVHIEGNATGGLLLSEQGRGIKLRHAFYRPSAFEFTGLDSRTQLFVLAGGLLMANLEAACVRNLWAQPPGDALTLSAEHPDWIAFCKEHYNRAPGIPF